MAVSKLLARRKRNKLLLRVYDLRGERYNFVEKKKDRAIDRASKRGDERAMSNAVVSTRGVYNVAKLARNLKASGQVVDVDEIALTATADCLTAMETGKHPIDVEEETSQEIERREKYDKKILLQGTRRFTKRYGGGQRKRVSGLELLRLRDESAAYKKRYAEEGPVRVEDKDEHEKLFAKMQANGLAYKRKLRDRARQGIDKGSLPPDVRPEIYEGCRVFIVCHRVIAPPDEERLHYETPEEAFEVATRWREFWDTPRDAVRAAKARRGGVTNVQVHPKNEDLFSVCYCNRHRYKSRFVREPGTGGSWYYDLDAALQLKEDYEKSNKDASWFVSQAEAKAAGKARQAAAGAKGRASQKRKREN